METSRLRMFMHEWSREEDASPLLTSLLASLLSFFITLHFYFILLLLLINIFMSKFSPNLIFFLLFFLFPVISSHIYHIAFCLQKSFEYWFGTKMLCLFSPHAHSSTSACCSDIKMCFGYQACTIFIWPADLQAYAWTKFQKWLYGGRRSKGINEWINNGVCLCVNACVWRKSLEIYGRHGAAECETQEFYSLGHWLGECFIKVKERAAPLLLPMPKLKCLLPHYSARV